MAFGSVIFILAVIIMTVDTFAFPSFGTFLNSLIIWISALTAFTYGFFLSVKSVKEVYDVPFLRILWEHRSSFYNFIGIVTLIIFGIPLYIINRSSQIYGEITWRTIINNLIWDFCFLNFTVAARLQSRNRVYSGSLPNKELLPTRDEQIVVKFYSELINKFLSSIEMAGFSFKNQLYEFFELNPILFDGCKIGQDGIIDFKKTEENVERIYEENCIKEICLIFSALILRLFNLCSVLTSQGYAEKTMSESYRRIRQDFGNLPVLFDILRCMPAGILEAEKIALLPREELEASVQERTKELEESRNYINNILESMTDMLIVVDQSGIINTVNKATMDLLGYKEDELIGQHISSLFLSDEPISYRIINDTVKNFETVYISKDHRKINVLFSSSIMHNEYNEIIGIVCVAQDITELKRAEKILRESEEKYRMLVENANEGIIVIQGDSLKLVNPKLIEIFDYKESKMNTKKFLCLIHPDDRNAIVKKYQESLNGKEIRFFPFRVLDKDKNVKWMEASAIGINWEGEPASLVFINDITERRKIEEELLKAQKLESIGILAGGIAHDFNNYLHGIMGNILMVKDSAIQNKEIYEKLTKAIKISEQARSLTQQLLTFAKGGEPSLSISSLPEIIVDAANLGLMGSNVKCEFSIPDDLWNAEVDKGQINQVLSNLIINAGQAMPQGGIIKIEAENVMLDEQNEFSLAAGPYLRISVIDQGIGIPEENLTKIFDPFFTTKSSGNGLGLAISYSIIKNHNGYIGVTSKFGKGTTFFIYLPAAPDKTSEVMQKKEMPKVHKGGRILVMDDEDFIRELSSEMLKSIGYEAVTAKDGEEAIKLYKSAIESNNPFSAVIMDLTVPGGIGGKEAISILKEIDPNVKAIVSSGYSNEMIKSELSKHGFIGVLNKPYQRDDLSDILQKVL
ncbi:MAG: PAS domain-containing hybrid sensor histidine kinase/response regulator [bacterium]